MTDDCQSDLAGAVNQMSAEIIQFIPKPDPDREERMIKRLKQEASAIYQNIFPDEMKDEDTSPCEMIPYHYVAPDKDPA